MKFLLPPYSRKHIIVLGSTTFFIAIGLLFATKHIPFDQLNTKTELSSTTPENLKQDYSQSVTALQEDKAALAIDRDEFIFLDVRSIEEYNKSHITGALSNPSDQVAASVMPSSMKAVVYSDNEDELNIAVAALQKMNIARVEKLRATIDELRAAGYKISE